MGNADKKTQDNHPLYGLLAGIDETYSKMPLNARLEIEKISQGLTEFGPRKLHRRGTGTEFFKSRDFRPDVDDPRKINARLSARAGRPVVVEKEAEIRQHFYLWRDATPSMDYASEGSRFTKKQAAEIMLLAFAKHLAKNEEKIGILDGKGVYHGGKASEWLAQQLLDVTVVAGNMPNVGRKLPQHSTAVLFSDFLMPPEELVNGIEHINGIGLKGFLVMVLDPQELDFNFKGTYEFEGPEGEGKHKLNKAEAVRAEYLQAMREHIEWVEKLCRAKGFTFVLQRTDKPLHNGLMEIYGLSPKAPERSPSPSI